MYIEAAINLEASKMAKQQMFISARLEKYWVYLTLLIGLVVFVGLSEAGQAIKAPKKHFSGSNHIDQSYDDQLFFVKLEIEKIQQERGWLSLKIKKMEDFGRSVPKRMHDSIAFKTSKILSLEKLRARYEALARSVPPVSGKKGEKGEKTSGFENNLSKKILESGLSDWVELNTHVTPLRVENRLPILFSSGSAVIAKGYKPFIRKIATFVKGYDVRIVIDGYADTDPIHTKEYASNFELGAARAAAIVHALVKHGIKPSVFKIGSTGEHRLDSHRVSEWKNLQRHVNIAILFVGES
jgi:flagellar motor protein MotB